MGEDRARTQAELMQSSQNLGPQNAYSGEGAKVEKPVSKVQDLHDAIGDMEDIVERIIKLIGSVDGTREVAPLEHRNRPVASVVGILEGGAMELRAIRNDAHMALAELEALLLS